MGQPSSALARRAARAALVACALLAPAAAGAQTATTRGATVAATRNRASVPRASSSRLHIVRPALTRRLAPATRRNIAAVGEYNRATAFLVYRDESAPPGATQRALVMTNHHVTSPETFRAGDAIVFGDHTRATTTRLVASSRELDYALVEVELPAASPTRPVTLSHAPVRPNARVYAVSAYASLAFAEPLAQAVAVTPGNRAALAPASRPGNNTIQLGTVQNDGTPVRVVTSGGEQQAVPTDLPNSPGTSGSPVFARDGHEVVALHSAGNGAPRGWQSSETPVALILRDVRAQLDTGRIAPEARELARSLLARGAPPR